MSLLPTERRAAGAIASRRWRLLRQRLERVWSGVRGRLQCHVLYLHPHGVLSWRLAAGPAADDAPAQATPFASFAHWCAAHPGVDARVRVSGRLLHSIAVDAGLQLPGADAVRRYARQQFTHYHGAQAAGWPLAVWHGRGESGACGLHGVDLDAMVAEASRHDVRLLEMTPVWCAALAKMAAASPDFAGPGRNALLLVEGAAATWLLAEDGVIRSVRQRFMDAPHPDAVASLVDALAAQHQPLARPASVLGWWIEVPGESPGDVAPGYAGLTGSGSLNAVMLAEPGRPA